jgi:transcriptional regulator with XRE-family HTH domain
MFLIARHLVFSSTSLHGPEIRFLRKRLGKKANDYARLLRITGETLSRIENEKQSASDQLDALVRMTYLLFCSDPALAEPASHLAEIITTEVRRGQTIFVAKVSANNEWSDVPLTGFTGSSVLHGTSSHQHHP